MKKIALSVLLGFSAFFVACATAVLAPPEVRRAEYIEETKVTKADAYKRALAYFAKSITDSKVAMRVQDEKEARLILQSGVTCNALRKLFDLQNYTLTYSVDFQAKDNKVRVVFEDLSIKDRLGQSPYVGQISNAADAEKAKACVEPIRQELVRAIASSAYI